VYHYNTQSTQLPTYAFVIHILLCKCIFFDFFRWNDWFIK